MRRAAYLTVGTWITSSEAVFVLSIALTFLALSSSCYSSRERIFPSYCQKMSSHINLQLGWPSPRLFPTEQLAAAASTSLLDPEIAEAALIYGPDLGYKPFRKEIAKWL